MENRLETATGPSGTASYEYDPLGRRSQKSGAYFATEVYLSDGTNEVIDYNASGTVLRRYIHGPGVDEPVVMYTGTTYTTKSYFHQDYLGSVIAMSDGAGAVTSQYSYDAYGKTSDWTGSPFLYTGRRIDPVSVAERRRSLRTNRALLLPRALLQPRARTFPANRPHWLWR